MNLPQKAIEQLLVYLCLVALALIAGMFVLSLQGRESSLAFGSFDKLSFLILGGILGALKLQPHE
jgi:uncharacterized membrane protein YcaP (DUF421 family)